MPIESIYFGGNNRLILKVRREGSHDDRVYLFDINQRKIVGGTMRSSNDGGNGSGSEGSPNDNATPAGTPEGISVQGGVKYVHWSPNMQYCALVGKHNMVLVDKNFHLVQSFHDSIRVKSGCWDVNNVFIYSTLSHVKYAMVNGDTGIIHSLPETVYLLAVQKGFLYYIDRDSVVHKQRLNTTE
jgi:hypothetical protein